MLKRGGKNKKVPPMEFLMGVSHAQILTVYTQTNNSVKYNFFDRYSLAPKEKQRTLLSLG